MQFLRTKPCCCSYGCFFQQQVLRVLPDPRPYFAEERETWLRSFLELPNGVPSHNTLSDVMGRIDKRAFAEAVHLMSASATQARLVLCQHLVADKGNEITAIPTLLDMLELPGAIHRVKRRRLFATASNTHNHPDSLAAFFV